ncbi:MAG: glycine dehydrogenase (aminomethyl-transferring), partial [Acidobacteria bacterium]|nr:glycine dehydrogenase (aminomethyl-transferring) [Acidobacteriota bacterium]
MTASPATLKSHVAAAAPSLPRGAAPFVRRHVGPSLTQQVEMLHDLGLASRDELIAQTIPADIRIQEELDLPAPLAEGELLEELRRIARQNRTCRNFIGRGYYGAITPPVILRNILEDPGWYT